MNKLTKRVVRSIFIASVSVLSVFLTLPSAQASLLLNVDLSVVNTVKISATSGLSSATASGSDSIGFYLDGFFGGGVNSLFDTLVSGNLTSANNTSDGTPELFRATNSDLGLNVWSYTGDATSTFTNGAQAFSGQAEWTIGAGAYADALAGAQGGNIYFPADDFGDVANAVLLGTWGVSGATTVPEAPILALLTLALFGISFARKRKT